LANAPENSGWIRYAKIAHTPGLNLNVRQFRPVLGDHSALVDAIPPSLNIFDQHVHHEILCQGFSAKVLEKETCVFEM
jgi:hypothetical protein